MLGREVKGRLIFLKVFTFDEPFTFMGTNEMAQALGISKAMVSKLTSKGMPLTSPQAAQAWREANAPPRVWKAKATTPAPITATSKPTAPSPSTPAPESQSSGDATDDPHQSLKNARAVEKASHRNLESLQRDKNASPEDLRKSSQVYFNSRANRQKAEADYREHLRAEGITLFYSEAVEITNRGHLAVANLLREGPKMLIPRLRGMPAKSQEKTLGDFFDSIAEHLRKSF